jgi:hypothetical protein
MVGVIRKVAFVLMAVGVAVAGNADVVAEEARACKKEDFESVVEAAASALRDLNGKTRPAFQERLRALKEKRKWSHDEFLKNATPFVRDDKTAIYDKSTDELLSAISAMGQEGAQSAAPDCAMLLELRARMKLLVDTQTAKWSYMFEKLNGELAK